MIITKENCYLMKFSWTPQPLQNGYGFKTEGNRDNPQYVDLGNWTGQTCFVDVDSCDEGKGSLTLSVSDGVSISGHR